MFCLPWPHTQVVYARSTPALSAPGVAREGIRDRDESATAQAAVVGQQDPVPGQAVRQHVAGGVHKSVYGSQDARLLPSRTGKDS